jgi:4-hydroxy-tetrahydrodipicolinate synthase
MQEPQVFTMSITPFTVSGELDEDAFRAHLRRMVDAAVGVYLASPGTGEGHSLSLAELERVYQLGVEVCKDKVPIYANLREGRNARDVIDRVEIAERAGVDVIQIYTVDAGHGMRPTYDEQLTYYREVLDCISAPVGLSVNLLAAGYVNPVSMLATLVHEYPNITCINVNHPPTAYLAELIDTIGTRVSYYVDAPMLAESLTLGASGCLTGHVNVMPHLIRAIGRLHARGDGPACREAMHSLFRINRTVSNFGVDPGATSWSGRWVKAAMAVLGLPGHSDGRMRPPYSSPSAADLRAFANVIEPLDIAGIEERAAAW